jgi:hypothetical protein
VSIAPGVATLAGDRLGTRTDDHVRVDAVLHVRVSGLSDARDSPILDPDVGLQDPQHGIHDDDRRDDHVEHAVGVAPTGHLAHSVAQRLAASVDRFLAGQQEAALDPRDQRGVGQPEPVSHRRAIQRGILLAGDDGHDRLRRPPLPGAGAGRSGGRDVSEAPAGSPCPFGKPENPELTARSSACLTVHCADVAPLNRLLKPITRLIPPNSTSSTSRSAPASKRID